MKKILFIILVIIISASAVISTQALSDEEAKAIFNEAVTAAEWFGAAHGYNTDFKLSHKEDFAAAAAYYDTPVTVSSKTGNVSNHTYVYCCYMTRSELEGYLKTLFSERLTEEFLNADSDDTRLWKQGKYGGSYVFGDHKMFEEADGVLYYYGNKYQEGDAKITDVEVVQNTGDKVVLNVEYEVRIGASLSPVGTYGQQYSLIKNSEGNWVFDDFALPSALWLEKVEEISNPETPDVPVFTVAAAALLSLCGAAVCRKKTVKEI